MARPIRFISTGTTNPSSCARSVAQRRLVNTAMTKAWFDDPNMSAYFIANTPIGRVSQPAEIAGTVLFLCSDLASFAVGQTFVIDGGYTTH